MPTVQQRSISLKIRLTGLWRFSEISVKTGLPYDVLNLLGAKLIGFDLEQVFRAIQINVPVLDRLFTFHLIQLRFDLVYTAQAINVRLEEIRAHNPDFVLLPPLLCRRRE